MHAMNNESSQYKRFVFHRPLTGSQDLFRCARSFRTVTHLLFSREHAPGRVLSFESKYTHRFDRSCAPRRKPCRKC